MELTAELDRVLHSFDYPYASYVCQVREPNGDVFATARARTPEDAKARASAIAAAMSA